MKKISLLLGAALMVLVMASCGSNKNVANFPCPECKASTEVFRYLGQHVASGDRQMQQARSMAANNARTELASMVEATVKNVIDNYTSEYITGDNSEFKQRTQGLARTVVNQVLRGTPIICEGTMPSTSVQGGIICFACVELTGKTVMDAIANQISNDEKLRTDFEYEKFKQVFEEEMSKL
jgi:hypothetical protein